MLLGFVFRMIVAGVIAIATYAYFLLVLSPAAAMFVALAALVLDLAAPMFLSGNSGAGGAIRTLGTLGRICAPVLIWPALAWPIQHFAPALGRDFAAPLAAGLSSFAVLLGGRGSGQDHTRNWSMILTLAFVLVVMIFWFGNGRAGDVAAAVAGVIAVAVTRLAIVWTETPKTVIEWTLGLLMFAVSIPAVLFLFGV